MNITLREPCLMLDIKFTNDQYAKKLNSGLDSAPHVRPHKFKMQKQNKWLAEHVNLLCVEPCISVAITLMTVSLRMCFSLAKVKRAVSNHSITQTQQKTSMYDFSIDSRLSFRIHTKFVAVHQCQQHSASFILATTRQIRRMISSNGKQFLMHIKLQKCRFNTYQTFTSTANIIGIDAK